MQKTVKTALICGALLGSFALGAHVRGSDDLARLKGAEAVAASHVKAGLECWAEVNTSQPGDFEQICDGQRQVISCPEDEIIRGVGDFAHGYWTSYKCDDGGK